MSPLPAEQRDCQKVCLIRGDRSIPPHGQHGPAYAALPGEPGLALGKGRELLPLHTAGGAPSRLARVLLGHCMVLPSLGGRRGEREKCVGLAGSYAQGPRAASSGRVQRMQWMQGIQRAARDARDVRGAVGCKGCKSCSGLQGMQRMQGTQRV